MPLSPNDGIPTALPRGHGYSSQGSDNLGCVGIRSQDRAALRLCKALSMAVVGRTEPPQEGTLIRGWPHGAHCFLHSPPTTCQPSPPHRSAQNASEHVHSAEVIPWSYKDSHLRKRADLLTASLTFPTTATTREPSVTSRQPGSLAAPALW